ncbi:MAG: cation-translocating P-type ATPase [Verrucomicrobia bacterium]|nr:cation-translocating P-type ATPase [Verrucomicrobiota bacterium]
MAETVASLAARDTETQLVQWHAQSLDNVLRLLTVSVEGLDSVEAEQRFRIVGANELKEARPIQPWIIFLNQFKSILVVILIVAGVISGVLGDLIDCLAILAIVLLNAVIGFYQEFNAEKSIAALSKMTAPRARVRRAGRVQSIPASHLVPGDVVELEAGDLVPADGRLLEAQVLNCIESALTGESEPVTKHAVTLPNKHLPLGERENMVFMGTTVSSGMGRAVTVATGMNTELGQIASLVEEAGMEEETPLQQRLLSFGRVLVWGSLGIVALVFILGLIRGMKAFELFMTSVSLAVAAVPEGLPAAVTLALAVGVLRMSRRKALVRKLSVVEALGETSVICADKTGTLTVGEMTVRSLYIAGQSFEVTGEGYGPHGEVRFEGKPSDTRHVAPLLEMANVLMGCNNAHVVLEEGKWKVIGDPTEGALLSVGHKAGGSKERIERELPKHHEIPFDSDRKRRTVIRLMPDGRLRAFINGAPDVLLERCTKIYTERGIRSMTEADREQIAAQNSALAKQALRVLGSAYRDLDNTVPAGLTAEAVERDLVFVGLAGMYDPPRPEAKAAVARCREAGIRVVMITGDHPRTALTVARELGIAGTEDKELTGAELDQLSDEVLQQRAPEVAVYARVAPKHKLRIVRALKANGDVVAMTGDGVNDAPALKGADIGIAMGKSGTEVTKQAADMVITDDNFASIVAAVEEGRGIYANIRKTLQYLLAGNTGELSLMTVCVLAGWPTPLLPVQLLWINLVTDGLPALSLAADAIDPDEMTRRPRPRTEKIADRRFWRTTTVTGLLTASVSLAAYLYGLSTASESVARTYAFGTLMFAELLRAFGSRNEIRPVWRLDWLANVHLPLVVGISLVLQFFILQSEKLSWFFKITAMPLTHCGLLLIVSAVPLVVLELAKGVGQRRRGLQEQAGIPDN